MQQSENSYSHIKLTVSQKNVLKQILDFVFMSTDRIFILKGYAGTGKTTLMRYLIKALSEKERHYQLLASTGRAAKVLANLSDSNGQTSTIHSMVYSFNGLNKEVEEKDKVVADKVGQLYLVFEPAHLDEESEPETIYIIDEASMVSDVAAKDITQAKFGNGRLLKDLLDYDTRPGSKFIFVGDPCQLPPIEQYFSPALMKDYFQREFGLRAQEAQLTEIMRQQDISGIVDASKQIRGLYNTAPENSSYYGTQKLWGFLPFRRYRDIQLHPDIEFMLDDYVSKIENDGLNSAVCICRSNRACSQLSSLIRVKLGYTDGHIQKGDLLMVIQNNMNTGLMNGDMVVVEDISSQTEVRARLTFRQVRVKELFTGRVYITLLIEDIAYMGRLNLDSSQQQALFVDFILRMRDKGISQKQKRLFYEAMFRDPYLNALRGVFGYAITCNKSQGGEWDDVYVHVPRNITLNPVKETYQWVYTSMTRARQTLHMIDDFYIK